MHFRYLLLMIACLTGGFAHAADTEWKAGDNYFLIEPAQPPADADKVVVTEAFSYACPACNSFRPIVSDIRKALPANAELTYLPASFNPAEDWPVFQRGFLTARALGLVDKTHEAMFEAIWSTGELAISDPKTNRPKNPLPSIEDVAKFYSKYGVSAEDFVATANSFAINTQMKRADAMIKAYGVDSTPTLIVNGKYRLTARSAGSVANAQALVLYLVAKESGEEKADTAKPADSTADK